MIEFQFHDNVDTFDLWLKDSRKKHEAIHIVFTRGVAYDVSAEFILRWLPTHKVKITADEAQLLSTELTQHLKKLNESEVKESGCND